MFWTPVAIAPLLFATLIGLRLPAERTLDELPGAAGLDYASRFEPGFLPLREGYIRDVLGSGSPAAVVAGGAASEPARPAAAAGRGSFDHLPIGRALQISPGGPGDTSPSAVYGVSSSPSLSADGSVIAYHSNDQRIEGMPTTPCMAAAPPHANADYLTLWSVAPPEVSLTGACVQVVVQDLRSGARSVVSVNDRDEPADAFISAYMLSGNGRYVVWTTHASNLAPGDDNGVTDVFVRDLAAGRTELISVAMDGRPLRVDDQDYPYRFGTGLHARTPDVLGSVGAATGTISNDGRYAAFETSADDIVHGDSEQSVDAFVRDRRKGTTERVSISTSGAPMTDSDVHADNLDRVDRWHTASAFPCMSPNGRYVAFRTFASNFDAGDTNGAPDVYVRDRVLRTTERVSISTSGDQPDRDVYAAAGGAGAVPGSFALKHCVTDDGRYVLFESSATNLVPDDTNGQKDLFVRDRWNRTTKRVSLTDRGKEAPNDQAPRVGAIYPVPFGWDGPGVQAPGLSMDGRYATFQMWGRFGADDPDPEQRPNYDVFAYDLQRDRIRWVREARDGLAGGGVEQQRVSNLSLSADAAIFALHSFRFEDALYGVHVYRRTEPW